MRKFWIGLAAASLFAGAGAQAQSIAELKAQYAQTMEMLNQAEAAGMDPSLVASLRESLEGLRQSIEEDERAQAEAAAAPPVEEPPAATPVQASLEPNLAAPACNAFGVTEDNYRQASIAPGNDLQMRTLCGHALELYSMYKRAVGQGHPEAWRTYDAHRKASAQLTGYDQVTRAKPSEGLVPDTKTAAQAAVDHPQAAQRAMAEAPPPLPKAPPCNGCVTPQ